jgi:hypothetical protein
MAGKPPANHQTTRLGPGRHEGPGAVVCVMELASMLAGERFSDRPASVCPIIGALLRAHNDALDDERRGDLYRYAAEAVGTRGDFMLQLRRAATALAWARDRYSARSHRWRGLRGMPLQPAPDWGPDQIARYVIRSLGGDMEGHTQLMALLDRLIETRIETRLAPAAQPEQPSQLEVSELVEQVGAAVEHGRRGQQLVVAEL